MAIAITCNSCGGRFNAPDESVGRKAKCPRCRTVITIPTGPAASSPQKPSSSSKLASDQSNPAQGVPSAVEPSLPAPVITSGKGRRKRILVWSVVVVFLLTGLGIGGMLVSKSINRGRQHAAMEAALKAVLEKWQTGQPESKFEDGPNRVVFFDPYLSPVTPKSAKIPKLLKYEITGVVTNKKGDREITAILTFLAGPERRVYEVSFLDNGPSIFINKTFSEDINNTEEYARSLLRAWLDNWVIGDDAKKFKEQYPDCGGKLFADILRAATEAAGKRLVRYDITGSQKIENGFKFSVTVIIDAQGATQTRAVFYSVFRDRTLSEGLWTIFQT